MNLSFWFSVKNYIKTLTTGVLGFWGRHTKETTSDRGVKVGGITTVESAIHLSNVMLVDGDGKATRIGARKDDAGKNVRISRRSGKDA